MANPIILDEFTGVSGIYALIDPTDNSVGYVGKSKDIAQRYAQHVDNMGSDRKSAWISDLADQDLQPELRLLEKCGLDVMDAREDYWLTFYLDSGEAIYNESKKVKCGGATSKKARLSAYIDTETMTALDVLAYLLNGGGSGNGYSPVLATVLWKYIAQNHRDDFDLFKVMLRKRGVDFNAELAKRT